MKKALLFSILITLFNISRAQYNPDSLIKKLKVTKVLILQEGRTAGIINYDHSGNQIYTRYDNFVGGPVATSNTQTFNSNGKLIQSRSTHSSFRGDTTIWNYSYDLKNNLSEIKDNKGVVIFKYLYDSIGRKIAEIQSSDSGTINYQYDKQGNVEEVMNNKYVKSRVNKTYYDSLHREIKSESIENNAIRFSATCYYDPSDNLLVKTLYDEEGDGSVIDRVNYKYDNKKRLIARLHFDKKNGEEVITGQESMIYYDNDLLKEYSENIFDSYHQNKVFKYLYQFN